jgi:hypothetical protein
MTTAPSTSESAKKPSLWPIFVAGLIMIALFLGLNQWLVGTSVGDADPEEAARSEARIKNLAALRTEEAAKLESYAWVDRAKGTVQIPIGTAMEQIIPQLNESRPRPAYPVVVVDAPAPAASPAPSPDAGPTPAAPTP